VSHHAEQVLHGLKDFQRRTVEHVFHHLYGPGGTRRFLVADEVGLGKTLIAKGVIAKAVDHLREERGPDHRIDVLYLCSNGDIARQNLQRLTLPNEKVTPLASRLTMLPLSVGALAENKLNFISFTPATSFDLRDGLGKSEERILLYWMLRTAWGFGAGRAAMNVFQGYVRSADRFREELQAFDTERIDAGAQASFTRGLASCPDAAELQSTFEELCTGYARTTSAPPKELTQARSRFVGRLRAIVARACVDALEPDLVILDEFQRFAHLLDAGDDEAAELARAVFEFDQVRVLCLSATPYKMYTVDGESEDEDHYGDFVRTVRFLQGPEAASEGIEDALESYRRALFRVSHGTDVETIRAARAEVERRLRRVIVRTERLAATPDRSGMLAEVPVPMAALTTDDVRGFVHLTRAARLAEQYNALELWKSTPYALSFLDDAYALKRDLAEKLDARRPAKEVVSLVQGAAKSLLPGDRLHRYDEVDPGSPAMRALVHAFVDSGAYRLLWIPPSLPYYRLRGAYAEPALRRFTKRLVFSAWRVAPRAIAAMLSYQVERRTLGQLPEADASPEFRQRQGRRLQFRVDGERLGGMPVLALLYPSVYLAEQCDPGKLAADALDERGPTSAHDLHVEDLLERARDMIDFALEKHLPAPVTEGAVDERWYWAAPLVLDHKLRPAPTRSWFDQRDLAALWSGVPDDDGAEHRGWNEHVARAREVALDDGQLAQLGRRPDDLVEVLALLSFGGPAVTMLRAFLHVIGGERSATTAGDALAIRNAAAAAASAFRALFNQPEVVAIVTEAAAAPASAETANSPYWRRVLAYCVDGCLQSTLDEYVHVLRDHLGLTTAEPAKMARELVQVIVDALQLRASRVAYDDITSDGTRVTRQTRNIRTHFALRFADEESEDGVATRADHVRKAFNSPFWPFVVASTSVGQEGLDFHTYCHAVMHWNVPSNPVDFEQREGRVHRYKNHAVRKNVATAHGDAALLARVRDRWELLFDQAKAARADDATDIVPYWVHLGGDARIERHIPALPLSRDLERAEQLRKSLAVYRMVFGQPRQEELVRFLTQRVPAGVLETLLKESRIDLSP
jgi:hypothetical protein